MPFVLSQLISASSLAVEDRNRSVPNDAEGSINDMLRDDIREHFLLIGMQHMTESRQASHMGLKKS